jgi:hypothetical protein
MVQTDQVLTITKDDAGKTSNYIQLRGSYLGIHVPTIDTAICYLRGSLDPNGTTSGRIQLEDGSAALNLASGVGGKFWTIPLRIPFQWVAVEVSATQTTRDVVFRITAKE